MAIRMQQRRGTAEQWTLANPTLAPGEIGFETDNSQFKIGDGVNQWDDLPYFLNEDDISGTLGDYILLAEKGEADGVATLDEAGQVPATQLGNATVDLTGYATESYVTTAVSNLVDSAPSTLNTLNELAAALGDDASFATTVSTSLGNKQDKVSGVSDTEIGYLDGVTSAIQTQINSKANSVDIAEAAQDAVGNAVGTGLTYTDSTGAISVTANTYDAFGAASAVAGDLTTHTSATEAHGATGAVVGTTNAQTLTNKTLTSPKINEDVALSATATELNVLDGITATTAELNILDGVTATATELNYVDGVTSAIQTQINAKAPLESPALTGTPTAPTATAGTNTTQVATTSFVSTAVSNIIDSAPGALDTLNELAAAINDDASFAATITTALGTKQDKVTNVSDTEIGYLDGVTSAIQTQLNSKAPTSHTHFIGEVIDLEFILVDLAPIESPAFTGSVSGNPASPVNANSAKAIGYIGLPQVILNSGNLTLSANHAGDHIHVTGASQTITIPANSSVPFEIGTTIVVINAGVTSSIAITSDTLRLAGGTTTGTRTLAAWGMATLVKVAATTWIASGNGLT
jgi:hypothetical protein